MPFWCQYINEMRFPFSVALSLSFACIFQTIDAHEPDGAHGLQSVFDKKLVTTRLNVSHAYLVRSREE